MPVSAVADAPHGEQVFANHEDEDQRGKNQKEAAGKAKVVRRYTWDVIAQRTLAAYRSVM